MVPIEAKVVDSTHLELSKPIEGPTGRTVLISLAEPLGEDSDRQVWLEASATFLASAYSDDEPDYTVADLKEINPEYTE